VSRALECDGRRRLHKAAARRASAITVVQPAANIALSGAARIDPIKRVEDERGMIARPTEASDDRIENAEIFGRDKDQFVGLLRSPDPRRGKSWSR